MYWHCSINHLYHNVEGTNTSAQHITAFWTYALNQNLLFGVWSTMAYCRTYKYMSCTCPDASSKSITGTFISLVDINIYQRTGSNFPICRDAIGFPVHVQYQYSVVQYMLSPKNLNVIEFGCSLV